MEFISEENYLDMCKRVKQLDGIDTITGNSNFEKFMRLFGNSNVEWIDKINEVLEG